MKLDNVLKIVWLINGIVLIGFLLIALVSGLIIGISELNFDSSTPYSAGENNASAKQDITLSYESPIAIYNTDYYLMGVGFTQYFRESDKGASIDSYFSSDDKKYHNCVNIIFLDKHYKPARTLLNSNAFIESFDFPTQYDSYDYDQKPDSTIKNITYLIAFKDTDDDGDLTGSDETDLYLSDLDGRNLTQVTKNRNVLKHQFINRGKQIFMEFSNREESDNSDRTLFAVYHIAEKKLEELTDIQGSLNEIEKIISR
jgi:hypothetical protein